MKWLAVAALLVILATPAVAADKPNGRMQACTQAWLERRDAGQAQAYKPFLKTCLANPASAATKTVKADGKAKKRGPNRMKICGAQWRKMKAESRTGGQSYREFSRTCLRS